MTLSVGTNAYISDQTGNATAAWRSKIFIMNTRDYPLHIYQVELVSTRHGKLFMLDDISNTSSTLKVHWIIPPNEGVARDLMILTAPGDLTIGVRSRGRANGRNFKIGARAFVPRQDDPAPGADGPN